MSHLWPTPNWDIEFWKEMVVAPAATGALLLRIKRAAESEGFTGIVVTGPPGVGKSMLALKLCRAVYGDWKAPFKVLFFKWEEVWQALLDAAQKGYRYPIIWWDDKGVWVRRYLYRAGPKLADAQSAMVQVIRTQVACEVATVPMLDDLAKYWRERSGYMHAMLTPVPTALKRKLKRPFLAKLEIAEFRETPFGVAKRLTARVLVDLEVPEKVYARYYEIRRRYILALKKELLEESGGSEEKENKMPFRM